MKNVPLGIAGLSIVASGLVGFSSFLRAQSAPEAQPITTHALSATVDYGNNYSVQPGKAGTDFERVGVLAQQTVTITMQFPRSLVGRPIIVEPLDGGTVSVPQNGLFVSSDSNVTFQFQTPNMFGACRVAVHRPDDNNFLRFWVVDPGHPENTPRNLLGAY